MFVYNFHSSVSPHTALVLTKVTFVKEHADICMVYNFVSPLLSSHILHISCHITWRSENPSSQLLLYTNRTQKVIHWGVYCVQVYSWVWVCVCVQYTGLVSLWCVRARACVWVWNTLFSEALRWGFRSVCVQRLSLNLPVILTRFPAN